MVEEGDDEIKIPGINMFFQSTRIRHLRGHIETIVYDDFYFTRVSIVI